MTVELIALIIFGSFLLILFLGLPVAFCLLGIATVFNFVFFGPVATYLTFSSTFGTAIKDIYLAIPLFVFMATILSVSGVASAIYDTLYKWMGGLRGGLAIGTVGTCSIVAAMTGVVATGVVTMGVVALPEMLKRGYNKGLAIGCIAAAGPLGILIPPSIGFIVIGGLTALSVGKLFMSGVIPGLIIAILFSVYIGIRAFLQPSLAPSLPREERATWRDKLISLRAVILPVLIVVSVLGGIYVGACTPTEAGSVGAVGCLISAAIYHRLTWQNLKEAVFAAMRITGLVMWLLMGGTCFASLLTLTGVSAFLCDSLVGLPVAPILVIVAMQLLVLILGMFMEPAGITVIFIPIFMPIVISLGFDPIWFSALFMINVIVGNITPPFGYSLFYMKGIAPTGTTMMEIYRGVLVFIGLDIVVMVLTFVFPEIVLWLPGRII